MDRENGWYWVKWFSANERWEPCEYQDGEWMENLAVDVPAVIGPRIEPPQSDA